MTMEEASQIHYILAEIRVIQQELAKLQQDRNFYKPNIISDMPKGGSSTESDVDRHLEQDLRLRGMLKYTLEKLQEERRKFEEFLNGVEDPELRLILRLRCVNNLTWHEIGEQLGMDRRTASRKFFGYFERCPQCPPGL